MHRVIIAAIALWMFVGSRPAHAIDGYMELSGGLTKMFLAGSVFGRGDAPSGLGSAYQLTVALELGKDKDALHTHVGLQVRYASAAQEDVYLQTLVPYPMVRFEVKEKFFVGFGFTPYFMTSAQTTQTLTAFARPHPAQALLVEAGYFFHITPNFYLGLTAALQTFNSGTPFPFRLGPFPEVDGSGSLRFYW